MHKHKNGFTLIELMIVVAILFLIVSMLGGAACVGIMNIEKSNGARVGVVNKLSKKGVVWPTYEGEMALEGFASTGNAVGANVWQFSVDGNASTEEATAKLIEKYMNSGEKVKITYREILGSVPWRGSTGYYVLNVEPIKKE